jgi:hypothetical protein
MLAICLRARVKDTPFGPLGAPGQSRRIKVRPLVRRANHQLVGQPGRSPFDREGKLLNESRPNAGDLDRLRVGGVMALR